jgi:hypothetical protein
MDRTTTNGTWQRWGARWLALLALAAAVIALVVVIGGSLDSGGDDGERRGERQERERREQAQPQGETYVVQPGDSLSGIADQANVPEEELLRLNPDVDPQALQPGETLRLRR